MGEPRLKNIWRARLRLRWDDLRGRGYIEWVVREVRVTGPSSLWLRFADGKEHELELGPIMKGPGFQQIFDENLFDQVYLEANSIEWPNNMSIAPETLYDGHYDGINLVKGN